MTTTTTVIANTAWQQVGVGASKVLIQGPPFGYRVYIGQSAPASDAHGIVANDETGSFTANELDSGDLIYVKTNGSTTSASLEVMSA